jgi:hypothetical protein
MGIFKSRDKMIEEKKAGAGILLKAAAAHATAVNPMFS